MRIAVRFRRRCWLTRFMPSSQLWKPIRGISGGQMGSEGRGGSLHKGAPLSCTRYRFVRYRARMLGLPLWYFMRRFEHLPQSSNNGPLAGRRLSPVGFLKWWGAGDDDLVDYRLSQSSKRFLTPKPLRSSTFCSNLEVNFFTPRFEQRPVLPHQTVRTFA
jgi:hypothetical protein